MAQINNVVVGTKYVDRKDKSGKRIATVIEVNTKTKTVMVEFEDGKSRPYVVTNFLKSFKKLEADAEQTEEKIEPVKVEKSEVQDAEPKQKVEETADPNATTHIAEEIINRAEAKEEAEKKAKKEKKKVSKPKKEAAEAVDQESYKKDFLKKAESFGYTTVIPANFPYHINLKLVDKNTVSVKLAATRLKVRTKKEFLFDGVDYHEVKGRYSATIFYQYNQIEELYKLLKHISDNFKDSKLVKRQSKKKEATTEKAKTEKEVKNPAKDS